MASVRWMISTAPEIFLLLAVAIGIILGRVKIFGFAIGTTACTLIVAVLIGQLGPFTFPPVLRGISLQPVRVHHRFTGWGPSSLPP
jgi:putative transport protein